MKLVPLTEQSCVKNNVKRKRRQNPVLFLASAAQEKPTRQWLSPLALEEWWTARKLPCR